MHTHECAHSLTPDSGSNKAHLKYYSAFELEKPNNKYPVFFPTSLGLFYSFKRKKIAFSLLKQRAWSFVHFHVKKKKKQTQKDVVLKSSVLKPVDCPLRGMYVLPTRVPSCSLSKSNKSNHMGLNSGDGCGVGVCEYWFV